MSGACYFWSLFEIVAFTLIVYLKPHGHFLLVYQLFHLSWTMPVNCQAFHSATVGLWVARWDWTLAVITLRCAASFHVSFYNLQKIRYRSVCSIFFGNLELIYDFEQHRVQNRSQASGLSWQYVWFMVSVAWLELLSLHSHGSQSASH